MSFRRLFQVSKGYTNGSIISKQFSFASVEKAVSWESAKPFSEIPGFRSIPLLGTAWIYLPIIGYYDVQRQHLGVEDKKKRFGDIYKENLGSFNVVMSTRAEDMQTIAQSEGKYPQRPILNSMKKYRKMRIEKYESLGIFLLDGPEWWELRQKIQTHMLKPAAVEEYLGAAQSVASDFIERIHSLKDANNEIADLQPELYKWSLESIAYVGLETRLGCLDANLQPDSDGQRMIDSVLAQFECLFQLEIKSLNKHNKRLWNKYVKESDVFTDIAFKYVDKAVENLKSGKVKVGNQPTVLQALLLKENLQPAELVTFLSDMLMGGIETTSYTIAYFLYNMARFPEKQEKLYQEIKMLLPNKDSELTKDIYSNLKYLRAFLKESMRYTPTLAGMGRMLSKDSVIGGYQVPAGTFVVSGAFSIHRDPRYFKDPDAFLPERWLTPDENFNPFAYVPFGHGLRSCIAKRIAQLEISCLVTEIIRNFKVEYHYEDIGFYTRFVNMPDKPLRFTFIKR